MAMLLKVRQVISRNSVLNDNIVPERHNVNATRLSFAVYSTVKDFEPFVYKFNKIVDN